MLSGKLYSFEGNSRTTVLRALAKAQGFDVEFVPTLKEYRAGSEYRDMNPLGRVPTWVEPDGFVLTETIAINLYFASQDEQTTLLGRNKREYASIVRWMSYTNQEVLPHIAGWFQPLIGGWPYNAEGVEKSRRACLESMETYEKHFSRTDFLVGDRLSLADLFATSLISRGFQFVLGREWRAAHPNTTRWFELVCSRPIWKQVVSEPIMCDEPVTYQPVQ